MKPWLLALVPAIIAGLISIAPSLWDRLIVPKYQLEYSAKEIGKIDRQGKTNILYSLTLVNKGADRLTNVEAKLQTENISFDTITASPTFVDFKKTLLNNLVEFKIPVLHADQKIEFGLFAIAEKQYTIEPYATSDQAAGKPLSEGKKGNPKIEFALALISAFAVFLSVRLFQDRFAQSTLNRQFNANRRNFIPNAIAYIATANGFDLLLKYAWDHSSKIDYFGAADIIYCESITVADRRRYETALKCFFLLPRIPEVEKAAIKDLINKIGLTSEEDLEKEMSELTAISQSIANLWDFRKSVDQFLATSKRA